MIIWDYELVQMTVYHPHRNGPGAMRSVRIKFKGIISFETQIGN